jgi:hypothetical protein
VLVAIAPWRPRADRISARKERLDRGRDPAEQIWPAIRRMANG